MKHLTEEQLSARLDGELKGRALEEAERHLAECQVCRDALTALATQDESLKSVLAHDPGEAYFAAFPSRVEDRIRSAGLAGAQSRFDESGRPGLGEWMRSPSALAALGGVAGLIVVAGLAVLLLRERPEGGLRRPELTRRAEQEAPSQPPPASSTRAPSTVPTPTEGAPSAADEFAKPPAGAEESREKDAAGEAARSRGAQPGRMVELKTLPSGEQVPVERGSFPFQQPKAKPQQAPPASGPTTVQKQQYVQPMGAAPGQKALDSQSQTGGVVQKGGATPAPREEAPAPSQAPSPPSPAQQEASKLGIRGGRPSEAQVTVDRTQARSEAPVCGKVVDSSGRPVAGAQVALAELGRTATSDANGGFCVDAPAGNWTLTAMAVGFRERRQNVNVVGQRQDLNVALENVAVLEDKRDLLKRAESPGAPTAPAPLAWYSEPTPNEFPSLTDSQRVLVRRAQKLSVDAARANSALLYETAAYSWQREVARLDGTPSEVDARFRYAEARFNAWRVGPSAKRAAAATEALTGYLVRAPQGTRRQLAARWLDQIKH